MLAERWLVKDHGGLIVGGAAYLGVVFGARNAGIAKKSYVLLLYPLISVAICIGADTASPTPGASPGSGWPRSSARSWAPARS